MSCDVVCVRASEELQSKRACVVQQSVASTAGVCLFMGSGRRLLSRILSGCMCIGLASVCLDAEGSDVSCLNRSCWRLGFSPVEMYMTSGVT